MSFDIPDQSKQGIDGYGEKAEKRKVFKMRVENATRNVNNRSRIITL